MSKQEIINDVYYDRAGFGSRQRTLKEARKKDKSITIDEVNEFFKKNVEAKKTCRQFYSTTFGIRVSNELVF